jgi:alpha-D-ribose 1-methylphosphonate 5-triphosphate synthase subunit PhnG
MTSTPLKINHAPRRDWLAVLARATPAELEDMVLTLGELPPLEHVRPPEIGMVMLRGRVGGTGDAFNFGEASLTRCALRLAGQAALGVGYTLGRDRRKAELIALFDALLQDASHAPGLLREVIAPLAARQAEQAAGVSRAAAASKVEFFTLVRGEA